MKKTTTILLMALLLGSCTQRECQSVERSWQFSERYYRVSVYSGGKVMKQYVFKGIINQEENSDGIYWIQDGKLIEVSGDYVIESTDNSPFMEDYQFRTVPVDSIKL